MTLIADIPLSGRPIGTANALFSATQASNQNKAAQQNRLLRDEQITSLQGQNEEAEQRRLQNSYINAAIRTKAHLENNDVEGLERFYAQRIEEISNRGGDPTESVMALEQLRKGNLNDLIAGSDSVIQAAQQAGLLPSSQVRDTRTSDMKEFDLAKQQGFEGSFLDFQKQVKAAGAPSTTITNTVNPTERQEPTKTVKSQIQKDLLAAERMLFDLDKIADTHSDEFLTTMGRLKSFAGSVLDKMDSNAFGLADFNASRTRFANAARQLFNQYRKEITGAAASEQEMKDLLDSMFNEKQGPREFRASFNLFMEKVRANLLLTREKAREGLNVGNTVDNAPALQETPAKTIKWSDL